MQFPLLGNMRAQHTAHLMIENKKLPHAIIIEGPVGSGKKTFAEFLAKAMLCSSETPPCGICNSCRTLTAGSNQDYSFFTPEKELITVEDMRRLRTEAYYAPIAAPCRVFVIHKADCMNEQAQNTLLKVIEEPPVTAKFIFLCESANSLLVTIRSRCIQFTLSGVEPDSKACTLLAEKSGCTAEAAKSALVAYNGLIGQALTALQGTNQAPVTAADILKLSATQNSRYALLCKLQPLQKDREAVKALIKDLKYSMIDAVKQKATGQNTPFTYQKLHTILKKLNALENALPLNPSTSLLICSICDILG